MQFAVTVAVWKMNFNEFGAFKVTLLLRFVFFYTPLKIARVRLFVSVRVRVLS